MPRALHDGPHQQVTTSKLLPNSGSLSLRLQSLAQAVTLVKQWNNKFH